MSTDAEVVAQRDAEIVAWLGKKAREYASVPKRRQESVPDVIGRLASKIARDAVRPDNMLGAVTSTEDAAALDLRAENAHLTALVAAMHAAAVGESRPPLLGLVEDVAATRDAFLAQQARADTLDGIAREMAARVAELDAAPTRADVLREAADALEARVADVDVDTRTTWAGMDADYLRRMAEAGESA